LIVVAQSQRHHSDDVFCAFVAMQLVPLKPDAAYKEDLNRSAASASSALIGVAQFFVLSRHVVVRRIGQNSFSNLEPK
jgi:hypothetical protein